MEGKGRGPEKLTFLLQAHSSIVAQRPDTGAISGIPGRPLTMSLDDIDLTIRRGLNHLEIILLVIPPGIFDRGTLAVDRVDGV